MDSSMQKLVEIVRASRSKQAIALCGAANTEKTHVLKKLSNWFRDRDAIIIAMKDMGNGRDELWAFGYQDVCIGVDNGCIHIFCRKCVRHRLLFHTISRRFFIVDGVPERMF